MWKTTGVGLFDESEPEGNPDDPHNIAFPCHPEHRLDARESRVFDLKVAGPFACPTCDAEYRVSSHRFHHPLGTATVVEWTHRTPTDFRVYPVPSTLLQRTEGPFWQDLVLGMQPEIPCPFGGYAQFTMSGPEVPTTGDLTSMGYDVLLSHLRHATHGFQAWRRVARLVVIAVPVTVNGYVAADAGEVLIANRWPSFADAA